MPCVTRVLRVKEKRDLHRVVYGHSGGDQTAGAVNVHVDRLVWIFRLEVEELRDDDTCAEFVYLF